MAKVTPTVSPFLEKCIAQEHLPCHFVRMIEYEMTRKRKNRGARVDLNKSYGWDPAIAKASYSLLRAIVLKKNSVSPILEHDILYGQTEHLMVMAQQEYEYQRKQVKLGKRSRIQVDFNVLYC
jgi:hypothetical protein